MEFKTPEQKEVTMKAEQRASESEANCSSCIHWCTRAIPSVGGDGYGSNFTYCELKECEYEFAGD